MSGIQSLISAGRAYEKTLESSSNNLTNASTTGYKGDQPVFREVLSKATRVAPESDEELFQPHEYLDLYVGMDKSSVVIESVGKNFSEGPIRATDNPFDLAIEKEGFFTISTPQGDRYTRGGQFSLNHNGEIVTKDGFQVLGRQGPIKIEGTDVKVDANGGVHVDGQFVDSLNVVEFRNPHNLQKLGKSMFAPMGSDNVPIPAKEAVIKQGMIEESNVSTVKEMVNMINGNRVYEQIQKAMTSMDRLDEKAISISRLT